MQTKKALWTKPSTAPLLFYGRKSYTSGRRLSTLFSKFLSAPDISVAFYHRVRRSKTAFVKTDKVVRGTLTFCIKFNMIKMNKDVRQGAGAPWRASLFFQAAAPRGKALRGALNRRTAGRYGPPRGETGKGMVFMLKEGEVRIPSGCAISGVFHKDGRRDKRRAASWPASRPCTSAPTDWAAGLPGTASTRNTRICTHSMCSMTTPSGPSTRARQFLERHFDVVQAAARFPRARCRPSPDAPLIWRYFAAPCNQAGATASWTRRNSSRAA